MENYNSVPVGTIISGKEFEDYFVKASKDNIDTFKQKLSEYNADNLFNVWRKFILYVDEFVNLPDELAPSEKRILLKLKVSLTFMYERDFNLISAFLTRHFGKDVAKRYISTIMMYAAIRECYISQGIYNTSLETISDCLSYCQTRRLYYVSFLYFIPHYCHGQKNIQVCDVLNDFQYLIDYLLIPATTAYNALVVAGCLPDVYATATEQGFEFNYKYNHLDGLYLEPQRLSVVDQLLYGKNVEVKSLHKKRKYTLYSKNELIEMVQDDATIFAEYNVSDNIAYQELVSFMNAMFPLIKDDYHIELSSSEYSWLSNQYKRLKIYRDTDDYFDILNSRYAFYRNGDKYYSNVFMLLRFFSNTTQKILRHNTSLQKRAGFIFEELVTDVLEANGFQRVREGVKRINHKEFDVVCLKNNCIYNFQCKNNYFDSTSIDIDIFNVTRRYHKRLMSMYRSALKKEIGRENLLKEHFGLDSIKHFVIARFPIISNNEKIISFNQLEERLRLGL